MSRRAFRSKIRAPADAGMAGTGRPAPGPASSWRITFLSFRVTCRYPAVWLVILPGEVAMKRIANVLVAAGAAGIVSIGAAAAPAVAVTHHAAGCSTNWGINAKHRGSQTITVATRVRGVRAGRHGCFDRLVI